MKKCLTGKYVRMNVQQRFGPDFPCFVMFNSNSNISLIIVIKIQNIGTWTI